MGELADDMIEGASCSWCGVYFEGTHGYPVVCKDCAEGESRKSLRKLGLQVATLPEMGDDNDEEDDDGQR